MQKILTAEDYMQRCLELAEKGASRVAPNPKVGCVIVHQGEIIGEGYHEAFGEPHAEVNAITAVSKTELLPNATLYVNLEPCSHYGKTPPCANLIVKKGIKHVVVGKLDNHSKVAGKGIQHLAQNGVNVKVGMLEKECWELNKTFYTFHEKKRPYYYIKCAQTIDGFIAKKNGKAVQITNDLTNQKMHKLRSQVQAILVGWSTFINDHPSLNTRHIEGNSPMKLVIGGARQMTKRIISETPSWLFISVGNSHLQAKNLLNLSLDNWFNELNDYLVNQDIQSILIEGGAQTHRRFFIHPFDEFILLTGNKKLKEGIPAAKPEHVQLEYTEQLGNDFIQYFKRDPWKED